MGKIILPTSQFAQLSQLSTAGVNKNHFPVILGSVFPCTPAYHYLVGLKVFHFTVQYVYEKYLLTTFCIFDSLSIASLCFFTVIDFCREKCLICDPETNFQSLRPQWASKANCTQRKGMQTTLLLYHSYMSL